MCISLFEVLEASCKNNSKAVDLLAEAVKIISKETTSLQKRVDFLELKIESLENKKDDDLWR